MPLVNMEQILNKADKEGYGVGSFSVANIEMVMGAIKAAEELNSPLILQIAEVRLPHSPLHIIGPAMVAAAKEAKVPVAVHFDHGINIETIHQALKIGFTSVMFDGSHYPIEENIEKTKEVIKLAEKYDAAVEAEIGQVGGSEDGSVDIDIRVTSVADAEKFYDETGVNALAVAIGNAHGVYKEEPKLRMDRLKEIDRSVDVPLVLHGGSGISEDDFKDCVDNGIRKLNVATATFNNVVRRVEMLFNANESVDYFTYHDEVIDAAYENVKKHIIIFGSCNRA
ncbi:class II aldolase [Clostridium botulinum]|uniref:Fructose-bisphosphate aldolase n=1 Tax=Clostridium botulinum C/D str. DC5 TaxID=1443128 RepID=A0A0A0IGK9_CLOBO|nr:class II fructose-bisphosphate aldolase [Clostridium botulinum]KEI01117.1 fructose-bisphosphate aldolase [Clostridium botulinum C/D str. BKT75002]KEI13404.1 fructose-bisphosphate aldolase [Clostridium botulinum C/D str. BKT2873]KGM95128.1 fructose-bisphosphate aldolase [Clostridium botulinum D str. CCUG 7971]KGN00118.1 fructose-bisphosphate aldolase [Clostridium botulinum C/D str. DC5]KOC50779.1 fructose-bisphosphate aldolase [Clostridium botulinum]